VNGRRIERSVAFDLAFLVVILISLAAAGLGIAG
jgi:hypothetical protein